MPKYRYVGTKPYEVLEGEHTVPVGPGDFVTLTAADAADPHNEELINTGQLIPADGKASKEGGDSK